ncbi:hypothetical protein SAMN06265795_101275 [Noviherbaspirillum humi]|uniref:Uncharacterized protein n=1 Tax=Noviherbaspirillum humi TaxID=1688639 RepID=A0A239C7R9_9BURK|nr:hypothetical protein [Noviherbaspirillum humi]SNS15494.1 hypothetical protein SAMN06265795_101275 [Noviherbaspirillum humi]
MKNPLSKSRAGLLASIGRHYSGPITGVALAALSAFMIVTGIKGLLGFPMTRANAAADLLGIVIVIGALRWMRSRKD